MNKSSERKIVYKLKFLNNQERIYNALNLMWVLHQASLKKKHPSKLTIQQFYSNLINTVLTTLIMD